MSIRFRKSKSLGKGIRLNLYKTGAGVSFGGRGARVGIGSRGFYTSVGIAGTGLYAISRLGSSGGRGARDKEDDQTEPASLKSTFIGCLSAMVYFVAFILLFTNHRVALTIGLTWTAFVLLYRYSRPQRVQRYLRKAKWELDLNNLEKAIDLLRSAERLDPDNVKVVGLLGGVLHDTEQFEEALPYLYRLRESLGPQPNLDFLIGNALYKLKRYDEAIPILQSIPEDFDLYGKVINLLSGCFIAKGQYQIAVEVLQRAPLTRRKLDDDLKETHYKLAKAYEVLGDQKNALRHYKRVYASDIGYLDVREKVEGRAQERT